MNIGRLSTEKLSILLFLLLFKRRVGRRRISQELSLGEGRVRRILGELRDDGLIEVLRGGTSLTPKGREFIHAVFSGYGVQKVVEVKVEELGSDVHAVAFHVRGLEVTNAVGIRDAAVREGADGAIISVLVGGVFSLPPAGYELRTYMPSLCTTLRNEFTVTEGDVVILAFSRSMGNAIKGALGALLYAFKLKPSSTSELR